MVEIRVNNSNCNFMTHVRRYEPLLKTITRHRTAKDEEVKIWDVLREKAFVLIKNNDTRHRHRER